MEPMKNYRQIRQITLVIGLVLVFGLAAWDKVQAQDYCYADWSQAAPVVAREKLISAKKIHELVRQKLSANVVRITLCKGPKGFEYRLVTFEANGKARKLTIDAKQPVVR